MPFVRIATATVLGLRVAYGAGLVLAPARLSRSWLGHAGAQAPAQVPLRGLGLREIALHGLALSALLRDAPVRPWLALGVAGDLSDIAATAAGRRGLPPGAVWKTAAAAGASAALTAAAGVAVDR